MIITGHDRVIVATKLPVDALLAHARDDRQPKSVNDGAPTKQLIELLHEPATTKLNPRDEQVLHTRVVRKDDRVPAQEEP